MKVFFELTAGVLVRKHIRRELENSKLKLKHWYPDCRVLLTESKGWLDSEFYFEVDNLPDSAKKIMENWLEELKEISES